MARRIPKTRFPRSIEINYAKGLRNLFSDAGKKVLKVYDDRISPLLKRYQERYRTDEDELDMIMVILGGTIWSTLEINVNTLAEAIVSRNLRSLQMFNAENMKQQGRIMGVDPTANEPWLDSFMRTSIKENVGYISTISSDFFSKIETIIYQGAKSGASVGEIRRQLQGQIGMTENRAEFIAVDQTGSIFGQMTAKRHQNMGVRKFRWRDSNDSRVRKAHRELDGNVYSYDDPPSEGLPGTPFRCRCVGEPVFDDE